MGTYTLLFLKWTTNKDPLYSTGNSAQCHVAAWMWGGGGGARCILPGGECTHVYETITTLLTDYTPVQNQKLKKKKTCPPSTSPSNEGYREHGAQSSGSGA